MEKECFGLQWMWICSRASPQCSPPHSPWEAGHGPPYTADAFQLPGRRNRNKLWAGSLIIPAASQAAFPQPADPASSVRPQLSWLLCQRYPSPPLQVAWPLLCAMYSKAILDSEMLTFLRYFLRTPSRIRVCKVYLSVFSHLPFDYQRELISISMSVRTAGSRTSYMNFLESIQLLESSHQTSSKCHPWFASFRNLLFLCV